MKCLFARKQMVLEGLQADTTSRDESELARLYRDHFKPIAGIFREKDQIKLDPAAIGFVHNQLCQIDLFASDRKTRFEVR